MVRSSHASPLLRVVLANTTLVEQTAGAVVLRCAERYIAGARQRVGEIGALVEREWGRAVEVRIEEPAAEDGAGEGDAKHGAADGSSGSASGAAGEGGGGVGDDPLVKLAAELFGARIVAVQPRAGDGGGGSGPAGT